MTPSDSFTIIVSFIFPFFFSILKTSYWTGLFEVFDMETGSAEVGSVRKKASVGDDGVQESQGVCDLNHKRPNGDLTPSTIESRDGPEPHFVG